MLSVKQGGIKYHFIDSLVRVDLGMSPSLPSHGRTLYPLPRLIQKQQNPIFKRSGEVFMFKKNETSNFGK